MKIASTLILLFLVAGCDEPPRANYAKLTAVTDVLACSEMIEFCRAQGSKNHDVWRLCIEPYARFGKGLAGAGFSRQDAMTCNELRKALYGRRYWFNGVDFR